MLWLNGPGKNVAIGIRCTKNVLTWNQISNASVEDFFDVLLNQDNFISFRSYFEKKDRANWCTDGDQIWADHSDSSTICCFFYWKCFYVLTERMIIQKSGAILVEKLLKWNSYVKGWNVNDIHKYELGISFVLGFCLGS